MGSQSFPRFSRLPHCLLALIMALTASELESSTEPKSRPGRLSRSKGAKWILCAVAISHEPTPRRIPMRSTRHLGCVTSNLFQRNQWSVLRSQALKECQANGLSVRPQLVRSLWISPGTVQPSPLFSLIFLVDR